MDAFTVTRRFPQCDRRAVELMRDAKSRGDLEVGTVGERAERAIQCGGVLSLGCVPPGARRLPLLTPSRSSRLTDWAVVPPAKAVARIDGLRALVTNGRKVQPERRRKIGASRAVF
jgi:hypothetical protein